MLARKSNVWPVNRFTNANDNRRINAYLNVHLKYKSVSKRWFYTDIGIKKTVSWTVIASYSS